MKLTPKILLTNAIFSFLSYYDLETEKNIKEKDWDEKLPDSDPDLQKHEKLFKSILNEPKYKLIASEKRDAPTGWFSYFKMVKGFFSPVNSRCRAYKTIIQNEVAIYFSFRGTTLNLQDFLVDKEIALQTFDTDNEYYKSAEDFIKNVMEQEIEQTKKDGTKISMIYLTGHSLGGFITERIVLQGHASLKDYHVNVLSFDAPGHHQDSLYAIDSKHTIFSFVTRPNIINCTGAKIQSNLIYIKLQNQASDGAILASQFDKLVGLTISTATGCSAGASSTASETGTKIMADVGIEQIFAMSGINEQFFKLCFEIDIKQQTKDQAQQCISKLFNELKGKSCELGKEFKEFISYTSRSHNISNILHGLSCYYLEYLEFLKSKQSVSSNYTSVIAPTITIYEDNLFILNPKDWPDLEKAFLKYKEKSFDVVPLEGAQLRNIFEYPELDVPVSPSRFRLTT